jgi:hypothetical protein
MQAPAGQTVKPPPFRIAQIDGISVKADLDWPCSSPKGRAFVKNSSVFRVPSIQRFATAPA